MATFVTSRLKFSIIGNGRNETLVVQPLATNPDRTIQTMGADNLNSAAQFGQITLQPGWNQLVDPNAYLTNSVVVKNLAVRPPQGATWNWTLAGATTDTGIGLTPGGILQLRLPQGSANYYVYSGATTQQVCDCWTW